MRNISRPEDNYIPLCRIIVRALGLLLPVPRDDTIVLGMVYQADSPLSRNLHRDFTTLHARRNRLRGIGL